MTTLEAISSSLDDAAKLIGRQRLEISELREAAQRALEWIEADELQHGRTFGVGNELRAVLANLAKSGSAQCELRAKIAKLEAKVAELSKPEWLNQWDDPEYSYNDPWDAGENIGGNEVMRLIGSRSVCDVWVTHRALTLDEDGQVDEDEVADFDNEADAVKCWDDSVAALRALAKSGAAQ